VIVRAAIVVALVVAMRVYATNADVERPVPRELLSALPLHVGQWSGRDAEPFADDVVRVLGVDEYVNRVYTATTASPVALYVGYYASQRQGDTIHSPQNCLPGAGWQPVTTRTINASNTGLNANVVVVQKGVDREVVVYWYQGRGRTIASEYASKVWLMIDAARLHRTDGGLVRILVPVVADVDRAATDALRFATDLLPDVARHLP
jgi:EpsI family protein